MSLIFLSSPYTHDDPWVRQERYNQALDALTYLLSEGQFVFSPIVHSHHADGRLKHLKDHAFWMRLSLDMLHRCDKMTVLMLDGWQRSKGVGEEIVAARRLGLSIFYMEWPR